jgi:hypothetical protein
MFKPFPTNSLISYPTKSPAVASHNLPVLLAHVCCMYSCIHLIYLLRIAHFFLLIFLYFTQSYNLLIFPFIEILYMQFSILRKLYNPGHCRKFNFTLRSKLIRYVLKNKQTNSVAFSSQANYTDWSTAICWWNLVFINIINNSNFSHISIHHYFKCAVHNVSIIIVNLWNIPHFRKAAFILNPK